MVNELKDMVGNQYSEEINSLQEIIESENHDNIINFCKVN